MGLSRRTFLAAAGAATTVLLIPGRAFAQTGPFLFGLSSFPANLGPWENTGTSSLTIKQTLYRGLLGYDDAGVLRPELAETYERESETAWLFTLRDAKFHDGSPVTAADVIWTFDRIGAEDSSYYYKTQVQNWASYEAVDARTIRIVTKAPTALLPQVVASHYLSIVKEGSVVEGQQPVGAGPFTLGEVDRGVSITVNAFADFYREGLPAVPQIKFVAYPDDALRIAALQSGSVNMIEYVPWQHMDTIAGDDNLVLQTSTGGQFMYINFNFEVAPFNDPRVRLAIAHAMNRSDIVDSVFYGHGVALAGTPFPPNAIYAQSPADKVWSYDVEKARALLAEAGQSNLKIDLLATGQYAVHSDTAQIVHYFLTELGLEVNLNLVDYATYVQMGNAGQYSVAINAGAFDFNDPDAVTTLIAGNMPPSYVRSWGHSNPAIDTLLEKGRTAADDAERAAIYGELDAEFLETAPIVTLAWRSQGYGLQKDVSGFQNLPGALTICSGATLEAVKLG